MIKPPIFIKGSGDLLIFERFDDAVCYLEPVDVLAGVYTGYDSQGRLLNLKAHARLDDHSIEVAPAETEPTHHEALRDVLIAYLSTLGLSEASLTQVSLEALIIQAMPYKQISQPLWPRWKWLLWLIPKR